MPVGVVAVLVGGGRVLLGLLVLPVSVVVGGLQVVVCRRVMAGGGVEMMLDRRVLMLFGHGAYS
jgi:hypothetical protein